MKRSLALILTLAAMLGGCAAPEPWVKPHERERLADRIIASQLEKLKLQGTYKVEKIGPHRQVLTDIVIGNAGSPDFTAERAEIAIEPRFGIPTIEAVTLTRPRIYGTYRNGKLSFGALDPVLFKPDQAKQPFRLPDLVFQVLAGATLAAAFIPTFSRVQLRAGEDAAWRLAA